MAKYTEEQLAVIRHAGGHALVAAVAGSGKTQTLLGRIKVLLRTCAPQRIGVFMFNRAVREDFRQRLLANAPAKDCPDVRTLNAAGERLYRYFQRRGELPDWRLEARDFVRRNLADQALSHAFAEVISRIEEPDKTLQEAFLTFVGRAYASTRPADQVFKSAGYTNLAAARCFPAAFDHFELLRRENKLRFLDDQLWEPVQLLRRKPELMAEVANRLDHVIVDEAQDLNAVQIEFIRIIAGDRADVLIVGDDDQSIYGWRGARANFMVRDFERQFKPCTRYTLSQTFRYGHELSLLANNLISNNAVRIAKVGRSHPSTPRTQVSCVPATSKQLGAASAIRTALQSGGELGEITVLVRYFSAALPVELELLSAGIPYHVYGRPPLLRIPELSALVAVLQIAAGQFGARSDVEARQEMVRALLSRPTLYLRSEQMAGIAARAAAAPDNMAHVLRGAIDASLNSRTADLMRRRADLIGRMPQLAATSTPAQLLKSYLEGVKFEEGIRLQSESRARADEILGNVHTFIELADRHRGSIESFLDEIEPMLVVREADQPAQPHVRITSIHRAKGLQWDVVLLAGLSSDWPDTTEDEAQIAEERRLAYVGMTRARRQLFLMHPADSLFQRSLTSPAHDLQLHARSRRPGQESRVSEFLWEARVGVSAKIAAQIDTGDTTPWAAALSAPEVSNAYLQSIRLPLRFLPKDQLKLRKETSGHHAAMTSATAGPGTRVLCDSFGEGTVERWLGNGVVQVLFGGSDRRHIVADLLRPAPSA